LLRYFIKTVFGKNKISNKGTESVRLDFPPWASRRKAFYCFSCGSRKDFPYRFAGWRRDGKSPATVVETSRPGHLTSPSFHWKSLKRLKPFWDILQKQSSKEMINSTRKIGRKTQNHALR
jgi:hypothetical protein